jgi:hypothetical protein
MLPGRKATAEPKPKKVKAVKLSSQEKRKRALAKKDAAS